MRFSLSHVADQALIRNLSDLVARDRVTTAELLAHLAEVEDRKLYRGAGYPSMYEYCVRNLGLSESAAFKRLRAARRARRFPAIFDAVAEGRLHLSAVVMLAPHLTRANAPELLASAEHKTKAELEKVLAARFPQPDLPTQVRPVTCFAPCPEVAPGPVAGNTECLTACEPTDSALPLAAASCPEVAPGPVASPAPRTKVAPLAPERFALQVTIDQEIHDLLREAQALLGHTVATGDVAEVLKRALKSLVCDLEKKKFARTEQRRPRVCADAPRGRHIPANVRRAVAERDGRQCAFVSKNGHRCESRTLLEFDHVVPVARGGLATAGNLRLLCRAHNQYAAECAYGKNMMREKRKASRHRILEKTVHRAAHLQHPAAGVDSA